MTKVKSNDKKGLSAKWGRIQTHQWLNAQQESFCQIYVSSDREFFWNGVESYVEAYDTDKSKPNRYSTASACASRLLKDAKIIDRINELLEDCGLNDVAVDKQLAFIIHQHADFWSKVAAIREYNKLRARIIEKKEITWANGWPIEVADISKMTEEEKINYLKARVTSK